MFIKYVYIFYLMLTSLQVKQTNKCGQKSGKSRRMHSLILLEVEKKCQPGTSFENNQVS